MFGGFPDPNHPSTRVERKTLGPLELEESGTATICGNAGRGEPFKNRSF